MNYALIFLAICLLGISGYVKQTLGMARAVISFITMVMIAGLIYVLTMKLTGGDKLVTMLYLFLSPVCGLIFTLMVIPSKR
ncbi:DUF2545 family protein [Pluralibacter sp.]|uniref:DUF2545 family protein n=1 Tax=Pluralibacter sp. TaxID=1920032 RepID=UPI0025DB533C|nr:DUF2545 family protein [Pluralibacter sp.]MBV8043407.1 DUF2545 family protein [Pluralibacter sp.]